MQIVLEINTANSLNQKSIDNPITTPFLVFVYLDGNIQLKRIFFKSLCIHHIKHI